MATAARPPAPSRFEDVYFSYVDRPVLEAVSLEVPAGRTVALVGHTGCGKTTLTNLIPRFYDPGAGRGARSTARTCAGCSSPSLRSHIGIVNQDPFLFSTSIAENIRLGQPEATDEEVREAAKRRAGRRASSRPSRRATRRSSANAASRSAAGSASASPSRGRWSWTRASSSSTTPPRSVDVETEFKIRARPAGGHARPHHLHHRPPAEHDLAGRRDRGAGPRAASSSAARTRN